MLLLLLLWFWWKYDEGIDSPITRESYGVHRRCETISEFRNVLHHSTHLLGPLSVFWSPLLFSLLIWLWWSDKSPRIISNSKAPWHLGGCCGQNLSRSVLHPLATGLCYRVVRGEKSLWVWYEPKVVRARGICSSVLESYYCSTTLLLFLALAMSGNRTYGERKPSCYYISC